MFGAQFAALFSARGIITLVGLLAIGVLIWFGGPYLDLFGRYPLHSVTIRAGTIAGLFLAVVLVIFVRYWLARRANRRVIKSLMESEGFVTASNDRRREEVELIRRRFEDALKVLRDTVFAGKRRPSYLFELPWYIIIGPPGAGKTTILRNSGLEFPLAERLGVDAVAGVGGTRNCDWWFTDEAVFIDTASRYTTQDTDAEVDRAAWHGFLDLLATHRCQRPINGVVVAISVSDLLLCDNDRRRLVGSIRSRIQELLKKFGMRIPIYVLVTKCDLLSGFTEYFDNLDQEGRTQVWGKTFPLEGAGDHVGEMVTLEIQELAKRLETKLAFRMQEERNLSRRAIMYAFPKEFWNIRTAITGFVSEVFRTSRFEVRPMLRGVYFTSGTQEGTPVGRVSGAIGRNFGLHSALPTSSIGPGKPFFIKQFLTGVIFTEQGLVGRNSKLERKLALLHGGGYIAAVTLAVAALTQWYGAFTRSEVRIAETRMAAQTMQARLQETREPLDLKKLLPTLNAARRLRLAAGQDSWHAWLEGLGMSATPMLAPAAQDVYDHILLDLLLPAFTSKLANRIDALLRAGNDTFLDQAKEVFRTYLMLSDPRHFDRGSVEQAARTEVALAFALDTTSAGELKEHFSRLIELLPKPITGDQKFVLAVGSRLMERPLVEQVYVRLLREGAENTRLRPIDLVSLLGSGQLVMRSSQMAFPTIGQQESPNSTAMIPGIFTRDGFLDFLLPRLPLIVREEQSGDWILGGRSFDAADTQQVALKVMDRYVTDYIRVWTGALKSIRVVEFDDMQRGSAILRGLAGSESTLQQIISLVHDNTNLPRPGEQAAAKAGGAAVAVFSAAFGDTPWPGARITEAFRPLAQLAVGGASGQPASMDRIRDLFGGLYATMANIATAPDPGQAAFQLVQRRVKDPNNDAFGALRADSALRPELVRTIMNDIAHSTWSVLLKQAHDHVNAVWMREVVPVCEAVIFQRYPLFAAATEDITLKDFSDFFRPRGILDDFFQKYLSPLVVEGRTGLALATIDGAAAPIAANVLAQFRRAQEVRKAFFSGSGSAPAVKFSIKPVYLASKLLRATFVMDGTEIVYRHEAPRAHDLEWPARTDASSVSVTLAAVDGTEDKIERSGPWALFRLVDTSRLSSRGSSDRFTLTIGRPDRPNVIYELRAQSVSNPFSLSVLRSFRCPDNL
ncbi:type VI secretion system membrane subunit TssM [Bradyrhizobium sp. BWA-3-5]|uniref:type VI secretion system membrane subunit TssM n=1 Tax=Bradyrhizobium sp. BWA-3-5 TaxID=3080013 RepID=UPI00293E915B|nr:type VI secretion system membrane subunit TssM [Bradyrhizobium sp. BWA-3-5]WOH63795.1 type VI secretion system membrane subunit TssM [Bradyrhizobium sp. BWA-3-5]